MIWQAAEIKANNYTLAKCRGKRDIVLAADQYFRDMTYLILILCIDCVCWWCVQVWLNSVDPVFSFYFLFAMVHLSSEALKNQVWIILSHANAHVNTDHVKNKKSNVIYMQALQWIIGKITDTLKNNYINDIRTTETIYNFQISNQKKLDMAMFGSNHDYVADAKAHTIQSQVASCTDLLKIKPNALRINHQYSFTNKWNICTIKAVHL